MAANFCLLPEKIDEFKRALKERKIEIGDLINMPTEKRTQLLADYAGADAPGVNKLFEDKLILKNRIQGIKNWVDKTSASGRWSPEKRAEAAQMMADYKSMQQERIFSPGEHESFLNDLADVKMGTHVTQEQTKRIFDMTVKADDIKAKSFDETAGSWKSDTDKLDYGMEMARLQKYTDDLKNPGDTVINQLKNKKEEFKLTSQQKNKLIATFKLAKDTANTVSDTLVGVLASIDDSFIGRQGIKTLFTEPQRIIRSKINHVPYKNIWWDMAHKSVTDISKVLGKKDAELVLNADMYSRPNFMNGEYKTAGIISGAEEQFPTTLPERVPIVGRAFKASEVSFSNAAKRARMNLYDFNTKLAKQNGVEMTKEVIQDFGKLTNSLTARGNLGKSGNGLVKLILWAPKMLKANYDTLTGHSLGAGLETGAARKQAAMDTLSVIAGLATVMAVANGLKPGSAETDPRSSDFGKIKIGNTRFDYSGGMGSIVTLASRMLTGITNTVGLTDVANTKSSTTGKLTKYGTKYGETNALDALYSFLENKTAPGAKIIVDLLKGQTFSGEKPSRANEFPVPISIGNVTQQINENDYSTERIMGSLLDVFGLNSNTIKASGKGNGITSWSQSQSQEIAQMKSKLGDDKFNKAATDYDNEVNARMEKLSSDPIFKNATPDEQASYLTKLKAQVKKDIFAQYGYKYVAPKKAKTVLPKILQTK